MKIALTEIEKKRLVHYGEKDQHQGHWGNGEMVVPEYGIMVNRLNAAGDEIELTPLQVETLVHWVDEATRRGRVVAPEDRIVAKTLFNAIRAEYDDSKAGSHESQRMAGQMTDLSRVLGEEVDWAGKNAKKAGHERYMPK